MTNEIKEILDDLDYCKNLRAGNITLKYNECDELLDYITNLQQRIDKALDYIFSNKEFYYGDDLLDEYNKIVDILRGEE